MHRLPGNPAALPEVKPKLGSWHALPGPVAVGLGATPPRSFQRQSNERTGPVDLPC